MLCNFKKFFWFNRAFTIILGRLATTFWPCLGSHFYPFPAAQDPAHDDQPFPKINSSKCTESELSIVIQPDWLGWATASCMLVSLKRPRGGFSCVTNSCAGAFCSAESEFELSNLHWAQGYVQHGEGTSQGSSNPSLQLQFPEGISLLFMNWQELDPMNPSVSCGGLGVLELMDSQLGSPVTPKTQHTWIKIVGWCHVVVPVRLGRCCQELSVQGWFPFTACWKSHHAKLHMTVPFKRAGGSFAQSVFFKQGSLSGGSWPFPHELIHWEMLFWSPRLLTADV